MSWVILAQKLVRSSDRGSLTNSPLCSVPAVARGRHAPVESYSSSVVSTVDSSTPATLLLSLPVVTPSARTKNAGQQLSGDAEG